MTSDDLANAPASNPPLGRHSNLKDPHSDGYILIIVGACMLVLMLCFATVRYYVKFNVRRKITPDDWTALISIVGTCAYYGVCVKSVTVAKYGTHMWDLSSLHMMSESVIEIGFHANWIPAFVWGFAKTTFFLMYLDLFSPLRWLQWACYIGLFVNWALYIGKFVANMALMAPTPGQSWFESTQTPRYFKSFNLTIPIATGSLVLDLYILALPIIVLSNLHVKRSKKLGVIAIFATGFLACVASTLSLVFNEIIKRNVDDYTYWVYPTLLTALAEMCIGIICSCMPSMAGFLKRNQGGKLWTWGSRLFSLGNRSSKGSDIPKIDGAKLRANTYINIETEANNAHELTEMHSVYVTKG